MAKFSDLEVKYYDTELLEEYLVVLKKIIKMD